MCENWLLLGRIDIITDIEKHCGNMIEKCIGIHHLSRLLHIMVCHMSIDGNVASARSRLLNALN